MSESLPTLESARPLDFIREIVADDRVNPAVNIATSDGLRFTLGNDVGTAALGMSVVSLAGNLASNQRTPGFVQRGRGLVFQLGW